MGRITKLRKSNDYVEMIRWIINVDEVERYMMWSWDFEEEESDE